MLLLTAIALANSGFAQKKVIEGIVFDQQSQQRIAQVYIYNLKTKLGIYNNLKGEFSLEIQPGDELVLTKNGYKSDTIKIAGQHSLIVYLKRTSIVLNEVNIRDSLLSPEKKLEAAKDQFNKIYGTLSDRDIISMGNGSSGAGVSIDALYNIFSKQGRNARRLDKIIQRDHRENVIDYRFNRSAVALATGLSDPKLTDFMQKYRPGYYFVISASDYDFIAYIRASLIRYQNNPDAYTLPSLYPTP